MLFHMNAARTILLLTLYSCLNYLASARANPTRIRLHKGWAIGNNRNVLNGVTVHEYLGIPMGKPPVGDRRFRRPEPVDPWPGEFNATVKPNACYNLLDNVFGEFRGSHMWNPRENMSEDCLYINAWVPNPDNYSVKKPIMIWIYGGGFYSGSSTLDIYDGSYLAAAQNVIVVSMQYRLGMLGFLNLESDLAPGNMGLLDQLLGLQWVQDNAEYLRGDKNNVTLVGESAGAVSVGLHLISPLSRNLFNRAIMQSGSPTGDWILMSSESSWTRLNKTIYSQAMGCERSSHVPTIMRCLLNLPAKVINEHTWAPTGLIQFSWLPSVDYYFLLERPEVSMKTGNFKECPVLLGANANEGSYWIIYEFYYDDFGPNYRNDQLNFTIPYSKHRKHMTKAFTFYPQWHSRINQFGTDAIIHRYTDWRNPDDTRLNRYNLDMAVGDYHFLCPVNKFADYYVKAGLPVYYYYYTHRSSQQPWGLWAGVMHADEIQYMFGEPVRANSQYTDDEKLLSLHMMELWANFSRTGDPNGHDPMGRNWVWPTRTAVSKEYYEINIPSYYNPTFGSGPRTEYCAFWDNYLPGLVEGTADINDVEYEWKKNFADWSNKYIVDWKHEYNNYVKQQYDMATACNGQTSGNNGY